MIPEEETKAEAFMRLYPPRLEKAVDYMRKLANLSRTSAYEWTPDQAEAIVARLRRATDKVAAAYGVERIIDQGAAAAAEKPDDTRLDPGWLGRDPWEVWRLINEAMEAETHDETKAILCRVMGE